MDEFIFNLNIFYAMAFDTIKHNVFESKWAVIRPHDQKWAFVDDMAVIIDLPTRKLKDDCLVEWLDLPSAMSVISNEIKPALVLPHLFCFDGATKYRYTSSRI